jgi:anti-sigma-K factor RskA
MSDASSAARNLRERLSGTTEERLGKALSDFLENPLLTGAIGRAFDAREKAAQAQEVAMGALNIPSAADIERLTRRLRSVSHRLEGIEDGVHRLDRMLSPSAVEARLSAIEEQLGTLTRKLGDGETAAGKKSAARPGARKAPAREATARRAAKGKAKPKKS